MEYKAITWYQDQNVVLSRVMKGHGSDIKQELTQEGITPGSIEVVEDCGQDVIRVEGEEDTARLSGLGVTIFNV